MSIGPPSDRTKLSPISYQATPFTPHPRGQRPGERSSLNGPDAGKSGLQPTDEAKLHEERKSVQARVREMEHQVREAQEETEQRLGQIKDEYVRTAMAESTRHENAIEAQRQKGYEALRELQRAQEAEMRRVRRESERELTHLKDHYRDTIYGTRRRGEEELDEMRAQYARNLEYEQALNTDEIEAIRDEHFTRVGELVEEQDRALAELSKNSIAEYERLKSNSIQERDRSEAEFNEKHRKAVEQQKQVLDAIDARASKKIREVRQDTSSKLAAYSARQRDPFYKMMDIDANLRETDDAYILTARIPEHERKGLSVSIRGDQIVLSGHRRNEEKLEIGPGRMQTTASFQSFQESFPISFPVEARQLTRQFDGDTLIVHVPKKSAKAVPPRYEAKRPEKVKIERPQFPENLPHVKPPGPPDPDAPEPTEPSPRRLSTRTLS